MLVTIAESQSDNPAYTNLDPEDLKALLIERDLEIESLRSEVNNKDLYFREMHHRIKNHLQIILTLFRMQMRYLSDESLTVFLKDCESRVHSIALIHEKLYQTDRFHELGCNAFISKIADELYHIYGVDSKHISLELDIQDFYLSSANVLPCGLIVSELLANALKYAFPDSFKKKGEILIKVHKKDKEISLNVCDNGVGFDSTKSDHEGQTMGLHVVTLLVEKQLGGKIEVCKENGTCIKISFCDT